MFSWVQIGIGGVEAAPDVCKAGRNLATAPPPFHFPIFQSNGWRTKTCCFASFGDRWEKRSRAETRIASYAKCSEGTNVAALTDVRITPPIDLSFFTFSKAIESWVSISKFKLLTGFLFILIVATPESNESLVSTSRGTLFYSDVSLKMRASHNFRCFTGHSDASRPSFICSISRPRCRLPKITGGLWGGLVVGQAWSWYHSISMRPWASLSWQKWISPRRSIQFCILISFSAPGYLSESYLSESWLASARGHLGWWTGVCSTV